MRKKPFESIIIICSDLLFLFLWGFALQPLLQRMVTSFSILIQVATKPDIQDSVIQHIIKSPILKQELQYFLMFAFLSLIGTYIFYCIFQSLAWYFSKRVAKKKGTLKKYASFFFKINLGWLMVFLGYHILSVWRNIRIEVMKKVYYLDPVWWIVSLFFVLLLYFVPISYVQEKPIKESIAIGIRKGRAYMPLFALLLGLIAMIGHGTRYLLPETQWIGAFLFFPLIAYWRVVLWKI